MPFRYLAAAHGWKTPLSDIVGRLKVRINRKFRFLDEKLAAFARLAETLVARLTQSHLQPLDLQRAALGLLDDFVERRFLLRQLLALIEGHGARVRQTSELFASCPEGADKTATPANLTQKSPTHHLMSQSAASYRN